MLSIPAANESWSFANCFSSSRATVRFLDCATNSISAILFCYNNVVLGVAVCFGKLFSIAKADWGLESC